MKGRHGTFKVPNDDLSACCVHEHDTDTDESAEVLT